MAPTGMPSTRSRSEMSPEEDLPAHVAGTIERVVSTVRDRTTGPALTVARALVYGMFAAILGITAVVVLVIGSVRLLDNYLPSTVFGEDHTWAAHTIIGLVFLVAGALLWRRRK